jgi:hypothetical protein
MTIGDGDLPGINFSDNTLGNATTVAVNYTEINISINETNLDQLTFYWDSTNYTVYNDSLGLIMNLDNISDLSENNTLFKDSSNFAGQGNGSGFEHDEVVDGKYGRAIDFDGSNDVILVGSHQGLNPTKNLTIAAWIQATGDTTNDYDNEGPLGKWISTNQYILWTNVGSGLNYEFSVQTSGGRSDADTGTAVRDNNWHYIVATFDGASHVYIDGVLEATGSSVGGTINTGTGAFSTIIQQL